MRTLEACGILAQRKTGAGGRTYRPSRGGRERDSAAGINGGSRSGMRQSSVGGRGRLAGCSSHRTHHSAHGVTAQRVAGLAAGAGGSWVVKRRRTRQPASS